MKISTRGRYGLRMLIDIAYQIPSSIVTLSSIAERQEISARYLEQVASVLKRAGYINSIKGSHGGYKLAIKSEDIIIGDLLRLLEGDIRLTDKNIEDENILQACIRESVYDVLNKKIENVVDSISLKDLLEDYSI